MKANTDIKRKLVDVTRHMIDTNGIDSVSMRDLGKEMNLSRSAVYRHFKSKEDLLAAITTESFEIINRRIDKLMGEIDDSKELIYAVLYTYYEFGISNPEHYHLMTQKQWNKEDYPDLHISAFKLYEIIGRCFQKAHEQTHTLSKSPRQLTAMIAAFIHGLIELHLAGHLEAEKGLNDPAGLIKSFLDIAIKG